MLCRWTHKLARSSKPLVLTLAGEQRRRYNPQEGLATDYVLCSKAHPNRSDGGGEASMQRPATLKFLTSSISDKNSSHAARRSSKHVDERRPQPRKAVCQTSQASTTKEAHDIKNLPLALGTRYRMQRAPESLPRARKLRPQFIRPKKRQTNVSRHDSTCCPPPRVSDTTSAS